MVDGLIGVGVNVQCHVEVGHKQGADLVRTQHHCMGEMHVLGKQQKFRSVILTSAKVGKGFN